MHPFFSKRLYVNLPKLFSPQELLTVDFWSIFPSSRHSSLSHKFTKQWMWLSLQTHVLFQISKTPDARGQFPPASMNTISLPRSFSICFLLQLMEISSMYQGEIEGNFKTEVGFDLPSSVWVHSKNHNDCSSSLYYSHFLYCRHVLWGQTEAWLRLVYPWRACG